MSMWQRIRNKDIEIDEEEWEIHIFVNSDLNGNNYIIIGYEQLEMIYNKIQEMKK